jgi:hypothetical protein
MCYRTGTEHLREKNVTGKSSDPFCIWMILTSSIILTHCTLRRMCGFVPQTQHRPNPSVPPSSHPPSPPGSHRIHALLPPIVTRHKRHAHNLRPAELAPHLDLELRALLMAAILDVAHRDVFAHRRQMYTRGNGAEEIVARWCEDPSSF